MEFLRRCLDDPEAAPCGRCDTCAGPAYGSTVSPEALAAARTFLGRPGVQIEPRKMWPTGLAAVGVPLSGKFPAAEQTFPGRAVGRLSDLGWGSTLRGLLADGAPDAPPPADLLAVVVEVLKDWSHGGDPWPARPAAVVAVGSRRRPRLVATVAEHVSRVGRLPFLGTVTGGPEPGQSRANSAQRVKALHDTFTVPDALADELRDLSGPVLLVDDLVDSGWTMAIVARQLLQAGAPGVLPLALALSA
jgi:ATP-dependent DNA helicase RecQ